MKAWHNPEQREQSFEDTQDTQPEEQPVSPPEEQAPGEDDPASITLSRGPTFKVHAFTTRSRIEAQQNPQESSFLEKIGWTSAEKQRLAEEDTRMLPRVEITGALQQQQIAIPMWLEGLVIALLLGAALLLQALSLFNYPAYTNDEGNYMANAWAVLQGKLTPYTFTYNHPPLGWIQIAGWTNLTGGITSFGNAINSGRVFMLVLATASSLLLYLIARRLSGSRSAALLAMLIYTFSPLSLLYRHQVLLDNIGTFWLLLSLYLVTNGKSRLPTIAMAAAALGIAILSKAVFLIFLPVMLYAMWLHATRFQRKFSLVTFLYIVLALASLYALFALLKGEILLPSTPAGGTALRPSLLETFLQSFQAPGPQEAFRASWNTWMQIDPLLLVVGTIAMFINIVAGIVNRAQRLVALFAVTFCLFLLISSVVYAFAIVPLLPLLALNIALALNNALRWLAGRMRFDLARAVLLFVLIGVLIPAGIQDSWSLVGQNQTEPQQEAMWWIRDNVSHNAVVIANSYLYTDLHDPQGAGVRGGKPFTHAEIYSNAALDPAIAASELKQDWRKIDFLVVDSSMLQNIHLDKRYFLLDQAFHHAVLRTVFGSSADGTLIEVYQVMHG